MANRYTKADAVKLTSQLGMPNDGDHWERWLEQAWSHLETAGLTEFDVPHEHVCVCLRMMALCWIANDFCGVVEDDEYYVTLDFGSWVDAFGLDALSIYLTLDKDETSTVDEAAFYSDPSVLEQEDELFIVIDEVVDDLNKRVYCDAIESQRELVIDALLEGWNGASGLFASLYTAKATTFDLVWRRKEQLRNLIEELESTSGVDDESQAKIEKQLCEARHNLEAAALQKHVVEQLELFALGEDVVLGDDVSNERMKGYMWCDEGCPRYILVDFTY